MDNPVAIPLKCTARAAPFTAVGTAKFAGTVSGRIGGVWGTGHIGPSD